MANVVVKKFNKIDKFIEYVTDLSANNRDLVYRGQPDNKFKITSSFERYAEKITGRENKNLFYQSLIDRFRYRCIKEGFIDNKELIEYNELEPYCQHYGLPTRLVDWTYSPYVALFFAYQGHKFEDLSSEKVSIFIMFEQKHMSSVLFHKTQDEDLSNKEVEIEKQMRMGNMESIYSYKIDQILSINNRARAQSGCFYTIPIRYKTMESYASEISADKSWLVRCDLPIEHRRRVLGQLDMMGISAGRMYSSVTGVSTDSLLEMERNFNVAVP